MIIDCLKDLNITWLIREPIAEQTFAEGKAVRILAELIVGEGYPRSTLAFASSDGGHYVYKLEW